MCKWGIRKLNEFYYNTFQTPKKNKNQSKFNSI